MDNTQESREACTYDAIIIGAGAAGAVFAHELTRAGWQVLLLEMGKHHTQHSKDFIENEMAMWPMVWSNAHYDVEGNGFHRTPNLGYGVGGGTLVWTAVALRFFARDFRFRSRYGSPAGSSVEDWPLTLKSLEPYYARAERQMGVSGAKTPWDSKSRPDYPNPPLPQYKTSLRLRQAMNTLGIRSAPAPVAINSRPYQERSECLHCGYCRSGCRVDAKYQADKVLVAAALETGKLDLVTRAVVTSIDMAHSRHFVDGVTYVDADTLCKHRVRGRTVIVCNNPLEMPRLLLNSANEFHPNGLGNHFDQVGRNFFCHLGSIGMGITDEQLDTAIGHNMGNVMSLDFCKSGPDQDEKGGFMLVGLNGAGAGVAAVDPLRRFHGTELKQRMQRYNQSLLLLAFGEGLPAAGNRVTIDPSRRDEFGLPVAKVSYSLLENDMKVFDASVRKMRSILEAADAREIHITAPPFDAHPMGTMRMGKDPRKSATDRYCRVHGVSNLFVGGAAAFVTGSSVNPTLTLHALALRTAERLIRTRAHLDKGRAMSHEAERAVEDDA